MAENDDQEKTEQASEKRLRESREKGEVASSRDLSAALITLIVTATLLSMHSWIGTQMRLIMRAGLVHSRQALFDESTMGHTLATTGFLALKMLAPVLGAALLATFIAPVLMGGFVFSIKALAPKPEKLNPLEGLKKMVSMNGLVELGKSLLKVILVGGVLALVLWQARSQIMGSLSGDVHEGIGRTMGALGHAGLMFAGALGLVGLVDAGWQKYSFAKKMRMTKQEVRDEHKETEGNPELKGHVRSMQQQMSQRRMMEDMPSADVVITNPTHFAVALRYDENGDGAPRVLAKGLDVMALQIRQIAKAHHIPQVEVPPLARALYHTTKIGREIPASLYVAVAQVLAYVYRLNLATSTDAEAPEPPKPDIDPSLMGPYQGSL